MFGELPMAAVNGGRTDTFALAIFVVGLAMVGLTVSYGLRLSFDRRLSRPEKLVVVLFAIFGAGCLWIGVLAIPILVVFVLTVRKLERQGPPLKFGWSDLAWALGSIAAVVTAAWLYDLMARSQGIAELVRAIGHPTLSWLAADRFSERAL